MDAIGECLLLARVKNVAKLLMTACFGILHKMDFGQIHEISNFTVNTEFQQALTKNGACGMHA